VDVRLALISGAVFAGVLVGGAVAAPHLTQSNSSATQLEQQPVSVAPAAVTVAAAPPSNLASAVREKDHHSKSHEDDEHEHEEDDD
jgi:hypothetical protein